MVDGKQRLQTIIDFRSGELRVPTYFNDVNLRNKHWDELDRTVHNTFWNYVLIVEILPEVTDAYLRNIFERMNRNSRKLVPQELRHAKYDGWFISAAEAESEKQEWKSFGVVTTARSKRMSDVQFISELFGVVVHDKIEGFDQDSLDELYAEYEDIEEMPEFIEDDFITEVEAIKSYIAEVISEAPDVKDFLKVQTHFYSLWGYLAVGNEQPLEAAEFAPKYLTFLQSVKAAVQTLSVLTPASQPTVEGNSMADLVIQYAVNTRGASTDLVPRLKRHTALSGAMHSRPNENH